MLTKILVTLVIVMAALFALKTFGGAGARRVERTKNAARDAVKRKSGVEEAVRCPTCGSWIPRGSDCDCGEAPTP